MAVKKWIFDLNILQKSRIPRMELVQGDTDANVFQIHLKTFERYTEVPLDLTDSYVTVTVKKADDTIVVGEAQIIDSTNGIIEYTCRGNELSYPGLVIATIEVYDTTHIKRFTTTQFKFYVVEQLDDGSGIPSTTEYTVLTDLIAQTQSVVTNENERIENENTRIANENIRQENESIRQNNEQARVTAENNRVNAESIREANENERINNENIRQANEETRNTAEAKRKQAENLRQMAEQERINAENARVAAENARNEAELARKNAENIRQSNESARISEENTRILQENARVQVENERIANENIREANEAVRQNNESVRITAEGNRVQAEAIREANEAERISNENTRIANENTRQSNEATRINNENIRQQQEQARQASMADIENRWNTLTTAQQQDAEVINARTSTVKNKTFPALTNRIEELEQDTITPVYNETITIDGGIGSIPSNAAEGQFSGVELKGLTATNLVKNGNFEQGTTGWVSTGAILSAGNNILTITGNGVSRIPTAKQTTNLIVSSGRKVFIRAKIRVNNPNASHILIQAEGIADVARQQSPVENQWHTLYGIVTVGDYIVNLIVSLRTAYPDADTANGKVTEIQEVMAIDMGTSASDNPNYNLTAEQMNAKYPYWFDGTKSTVGAVRIKSIGKNLIQPTLDGWIKEKEGILIIENGVFSYQRTSPADYDRIYKLFKVKPNTSYSASVNVLTLREGHSFAVFIRDGHISGEVLANFSSEYSTGVKKRTFTTLSDTICVILYGGGTGTYYSFKDFQIEKGDTSTPYEPYTESNAYVIAKDEEGNILELRSLPNGTKDEIRASGGKAELVKRVGEVVLDGSENWNMASPASANPDNIRVYTTISDALNGSVCRTNRFIDNVDTVYYEGAKFAVANKNFHISIALDKLQVPNIDGVKQWLRDNPVTLNYQLAEPVITQYQPQSLIGYPNGTVYWEPVVKDIAIYNNGIAIVNPNIPIKAIQAVYKIDGQSKIEIPLANVTVAGDKLSFTITGAQNGEAYEYIYEYDTSLTTIPTIEATVNMNLKAVVNSTSKAVDSLNKYTLDLNAFTVAMLLNHEMRLTLLEVQ